MIKLRIAALIASVVLCSSTLFATDGVIEINQARALAGNVTPTDTAGFPVTISKAGSYRLTGNLDTTGMMSTDIILLASFDVTLDLNGFSIIGCNGGCVAGGGTNNVGIRTPNSRIIIKNGIVRGMTGDGILTASGGIIEGVTVAANAGNGMTLGGDTTVTRCHATGNTGAGMIVGSRSLIQYCVVSNNGAGGIGIGFGGLVMNNNVGSNGGNGITTSTGSGTSVIGNSVFGHSGFGLSGNTSTGYAGNVFNNVSGTNVGGTPVQTGQNLCGTVLCP